jgi:hypothetical protein
MTSIPITLVSSVAVLANCELEVRFTDGGLFEAKERMSQTCIVTSRSVGSPPAAAAGFVMSMDVLEFFMWFHWTRSAA